MVNILPSFSSTSTQRFLKLKPLLVSLWTVCLPLMPVARGPLACAEERPIEYVEAKTLDLSKDFKTQKDWHITVYVAKDLKEWTETVAREPAEGISDRPLRFCFWSDPATKGQQCQIAQLLAADGNARTFQHLVDLSMLCIQPPTKMGVLLQVRNEGYGLGMASMGQNHVSLWGYDPETGRFGNLLPPITFSDQGEFKILPEGKPVNSTLAVVADFVWGKGEARYGRHKFTLTIFRINGRGVYEFAARFITKKSYKSMDEADSIDVIRHELTGISNSLRRRP